MCAPAAAAEKKSFLEKLDWKAEKYFGRATVEEIRQTYGFVEDPLLVSYISKMGQSLSGVSDRTDIPYEFYVVDTDEVNAFAAPGGFIFVTRGLIDESETEDEIAGVIGHEVAHVAKRHGAKRIKQLPLIMIGMSILQAKTNEQTTRIADIALSLMQLHYSREDEYEADQYGERYSFNAGYDPYGMVTFFEKLKKQQPDGNLNRLDVALSSHPKTTGRIAKVEAAPEMADTIENKMRVAKSYADRFYYYEAAAAYEEALRLNPENADALEGLALAKAGMGDAAPEANTADEKLAPIAPDFVPSEERDVALASLDTATALMERDAITATEDLKRLGERLNTMRNSFTNDLNGYRETAGKIVAGDALRVNIIGKAAEYFDGYAQALDYYQIAGEQIVASRGEMIKSAREARYWLETAKAPPKQAVDAAHDMASILKITNDEASRLFSRLELNVMSAQRTYDAARGSMRDLDISLLNVAEPLDSFRDRSMSASFDDQTERLSNALEDTDEIDGAIAARRVGMRRAELNLNASLMTPKETAVFRKMLFRRFNIKPEDLEALEQKGFGYGDGIIIVDQAVSANKKPLDLIADYDPAKGALDAFLAASAPQSAKNRESGARGSLEGARIVLGLAESDMKQITRRRQLIEMAPVASFTPDQFAPADLSAADPELEAAIQLYNDNKYDEAKKTLDTRGRSKPATALSHIVLGLVYRGMEDYDKALAEFKYAAKKDGGNTMIVMLIGDTLSDLGLYAEAEAEYDSAVKKDQNYADAYAMKGFALAMQGKSDLAEVQFDKAVELGTQNPATFLNLGLLYYQEGRLADALAAFDKSLGINPDQPLVAEMANKLNS